MFSIREVRQIAQKLGDAEFLKQLGPFVLIQRPPRPIVARRAAELAMAQTAPSRRDLKEESALSIIREFTELMVATLPPVRTHDELVVGRQPDCDLVIDEASVSKRHAVLKWNAETKACSVKDLGSTNGTFVDEVALGRREHRLEEMAVLSFGDVDYWFMMTPSLHWRLSRWTDPG